MIVKYKLPKRWLIYRPLDILNNLVEAKAAVMSLRAMPYHRGWAEALQEVQLKSEVAGTSRIEGADFTDKELDAALQRTPEELITRSQRQAHAAVETYRWISKMEDDRPIDTDLIREVHRRIISGADDDHCPPGRIRGDGHNV